MMRLLRRPVTNALCLFAFSAFYMTVFLVNAGKFRSAWVPGATDLEAGSHPVLKNWCAFVGAGHLTMLAVILMAVSVLVVILLMARRHPYDEYHTALLIRCLVVSALLTFAAIAVFFLLILHEPDFATVKFLLFITVHWTTVVLCDLVFVLLCRWR